MNERPTYTDAAYSVNQSNEMLRRVVTGLEDYPENIEYIRPELERLIKCVRHIPLKKLAQDVDSHVDAEIIGEAANELEKLAKDAEFKLRLVVAKLENHSMDIACVLGHIQRVLEMLTNDVKGA